MTEVNYKEMNIHELTEYCAQEYTELSIRGKKLDVAKSILFAKMAETGTGEVKSPFGRFVQYFRTTYTYPEDVIALKNVLIAAEETAKSEGRVTETKVATYKYAALKKEASEF